MSKENANPVPESKKKLVEELAHKIKTSKTVLIASIKSLPSAQFHLIKKKMRGKAEIKVVKKSLIIRAIDKVEKGALKNLKDSIGADVALFFSELDAFELSGLLTENQSPGKAKPGDIAPEDIIVEPGPTDLMPGPAISELGSVGLKVSVENGKLSIKQGATITKEGEVVSDKAASVMSKLGIAPMRLGFIPVAAYDSVSEKVYVGIKIDKPGTLAALREAISKSIGFAVNVGFVNEKTIGFFIGRAGMEGKAIENLVLKSGSQSEDKTAKEDA